MAQTIPTPNFTPGPSPSFSPHHSFSNSDMGSDLYPSLAFENSPPEPNPPFVFPLRKESTSATSSEAEISARGSVPSSPAKAEGSTRRHRPQKLSMAGLPDFSFNPGDVSASADPQSSPEPHSPTSSINLSNRAARHRRQNSQAVGGNETNVVSGQSSASPTKSDFAMPQPPAPRLAPPSGRPRHAHRRSGAVSTHDLSGIMTPPAFKKSPKLDAVPRSPAAAENPMFAGHTMRSMSMAGLGQQTPPESPARRGSLPSPTTPRARVGFDENVQYIPNPRPLSTISSETSGSGSTVRGGHSVTGSISSIVNLPEAGSSTSLLSNEKLGSMPEEAQQDQLEIPDFGFGTGESCSEAAILERPHSGSGSAPLSEGTGSPMTPELTPRQQRFMVDPQTDGDISSSVRSGTAMFDISNAAVSEEDADMGLSNAASSTEYDSDQPRPKTTPQTKASKKPKKVKQWAGTILSNKKGRASKQTSTAQPASSPPLTDYEVPTETLQTRRSQTPPVLNRAASDLLNLDLDDVNFDDDNTYIIRTPTIENAPQPPQLQTSFLPYSSTSQTYPPDPDLMSPVIDLDAALGPFNTPELGNTSGRFGGGFSVAKRRMHSSGEMGGFFGRGMDYHRRADSAPVLTPWNMGSFGNSRQSLHSDMADVFEEDEEGEEEAAKADMLSNKTSAISLHDQDGQQGLGIEINQSSRTEHADGNGSSGNDFESDFSDQRGVKRKGSHLSAGHRNNPSAVSDQSSVSATPIVEEESPVEIVSDSEDPSVDRSSGSTITAPTTVDHLKRPASAPMDFAYRAPRLPYADSYRSSVSNSNVSSPDPSNVSFDMPVSATAPSFTDRQTLSSLGSGEPGPEYRMSVDDVPSLTSSASTTPNFGARHPTGARLRTSDAPGDVARKHNRFHEYRRSSLASLSSITKMMNPGYDKTKAPHEAGSETAEDKPKKKSHRMSRLVRFWKNKEKDGSSKLSKGT